MNRNEKQKLEKIYRDCIDLHRRKELTGYGEGQRDLCVMLLKKNRQPVSKLKRPETA